jgi:hypothetical protein
MSKRAIVISGALIGLLAAAAQACGSAQSNDDMDELLVPVSAMSENPFGNGPPKHVDETTSGGGATGDMNDEQKDSIRGAIKTGTDSSKQCFASVPNAKTTGEAEVKVTFDGSTGHVSGVDVGAPFAGSELESCIKQAFNTQIVLKFDGPPLTVPAQIKIENPKNVKPATSGSAAPKTTPPKNK